MTDRFTLPPDVPDPYEEEMGAYGNIPAFERFQETLREAWENFLKGILETQDYSEMQEKIATIRLRYEANELDYHDFVVDVLETLNMYTVPLTHSLMQQYGIEDFNLRYEDFDRICLDFISAKSPERIIVDPDSIPEEMDEFPMSRSEIGDTIDGTLQKTADGRWYCKGRGLHGSSFPIADSDMPHAIDENEGRAIRGIVKNDKIESCTLIV